MERHRQRLEVIGGGGEAQTAVERDRRRWEGTRRRRQRWEAVERYRQRFVGIGDGWEVLGAVGRHGMCLGSTGGVVKRWEEQG